MISTDVLNTNDYELLMLYQENNEDAKNILYMKYRYIVDILIKKYIKLIIDFNIDMQEVYSECYVGFSNALKSFQEDKNASIRTFITLCVERKISALIRKYKQEKYKLYQDSFSLDFTYDGDVSLMDTISDDSYDPLKNMAEKEQYEDLINRIKKVLTTTEYEVFMLMINDLNYHEIAKILNKTAKQIDNTMQRIKNKIKKIINETNSRN